MPKGKKSDYAPQSSEDTAPPCHAAGCAEPGLYKAPKSRDELHDYSWFCLEHIREHNQKWDFFAGYDREQIESFIKDATTGHRPTWSREDRIRQSYRQLQDALYEFLHFGTRPSPNRTPYLPAKLRKALAVLDIGYPFTPRELKTRYRAMVKQHHPDVNRGDKRSEELFKKITAAYHYLREHIHKN